MVYLEPAPYIMGLVDAVKTVWGGPIDAKFVDGAMTQPWDCDLRSQGLALLPSGSRRASRVIWEYLQSRRYDLVHLAGWGHSVLLVSLLAAAVCRVPVVIESDTPAPDRSTLWKRIVKKPLYRLLFRIPAFFLPAGTRQTNYLRNYGVKVDRICAAQMTVDVAAMSAYADSLGEKKRQETVEQYGLPEQGVRFLYVGRLEPHKGIHDLVDAFRRAHESNPRTSLIIVGDGSLASWVSHQAVPDGSIYYLGRQSGQALWRLYAVASVLVLPSRVEPWGLVVNEAMACGLPVIVSNLVGCIDDLVKHGQTGLIFRAGSVEALANAMTKLADNAEIRARMTAHARQLISGWTLENSAKIIASTWKRVLA